MSNNQNSNIQPEENEIDEVVFNESYEAEEVESTVITPEESLVEEPVAMVELSEDYEDEDELDRIPLDETTNQSSTNQSRNQRTSKKNKKPVGLGVTAMILGILSILLFCNPILGLVLGAVAVVLGIVASARGNGKQMGNAGIIMGVISLLCYLVIFIIFGGVFHNVNKFDVELTDTAWRRTTDGSVLYLYSDGTFIDVEKEGDFTDNFYSGTYDILAYEETGISFSGIEANYDTEYSYDVHLYVDTYVSDGEERNNIANTIQYLFLFDVKYADGDVVSVCAHDTERYGNIYPVKETVLIYPSNDNVYIPGNATDESATETEASTESITETETEVSTEATTETETEASTEGTTETTTEVTSEATTEVSTEPVTEATTEASTEPATETTTEVNTEATTDTENEATTTTEATGDNDSLWGDMEDFFEDAKDEFDEFSSSASEEWEDNSEEFNSVFDEASSAFDEASSAIDEIEEQIDTNKIQQFFQGIIKAIQDWLSKWGF
ncbi:MAG: DUF4190 domain-containing protein [Lachnospiraceae bacterium]|nr:DUF4190 domain-containing protein [Lachnospiraceae bacterium]